MFKKAKLLELQCLERAKILRVNETKLSVYESGIHL